MAGSKVVGLTSTYAAEQIGEALRKFKAKPGEPMTDAAKVAVQRVIDATKKEVVDVDKLLERGPLEDCFCKENYMNTKAFLNDSHNAEMLKMSEKFSSRISSYYMGSDVEVARQFYHDANELCKENGVKEQITKIRNFLKKQAGKSVDAKATKFQDASLDELRKNSNCKATTINLSDDALTALREKLKPLNPDA